MHILDTFAPLRVKKVKADAFAVAAQITVLIARNAGVPKETAKHISYPTCGAI